MILFFFINKNFLLLINERFEELLPERNQDSFSSFFIFKWLRKAFNVLNNNFYFKKFILYFCLQFFLKKS